LPKEESYEMVICAIDGSTGTWEVAVGLEGLVQVVGRAELLSGLSTAFGAALNTDVSFIDAAFLGMLPLMAPRKLDENFPAGLRRCFTRQEGASNAEIRYG
jgi:hypothetical protein